MPVGVPEGAVFAALALTVAAFAPGRRCWKCWAAQCGTPTANGHRLSTAVGWDAGRPAAVLLASPALLELLELLLSS